MTRIRVLQTCGAAFLAIAHIICRRMVELKGPIVSSMSQKLAFFSTCATALPSIDDLEIRWLSFLGSLDDYILKSERIAEVVFPPSARLFDKIEELACATLFLPRKVEDGLDKFPIIMQQVPFLDWALVHLIAWLNFLISALTHWGSNPTREKEITIDMSCNNNDNLDQNNNNNNLNNSEESAEPTDKKAACFAPEDQKHVPLSEDICPTNSADSESEPTTSYSSLVVPNLSMQSMETDLISSPVSSTSGSTVTDNTDTSFLIDSWLPSMTDSVGSGKCSYKEILTKGVKEEAEGEPPDDVLQEKGETPVEDDGKMKKHSAPEDHQRVKPMVFEAKGGEISRGKIVKKKKKGKAEKDQILRLFDASWSLS
ncbi:superoxide-generating NADPH oxidase heavy chain subunit C [Ipomoea triloba]|uniref:superoxide-generating NADPH oxidase heavy chain subunit C n=1 Tax=Ipomoea triloba TaxID=35885 RepID=UPI00125D11DD|nr:superoxide-generating NADPH oxidase heavy chain subunit C [Ipomoea triloba]